MKGNGYLSLLTVTALTVLVAAMLMSGCVSRYERDIAMAQAAAAQANAQERIAYHDSQAAIVREQETTKRDTAWSATLPWLAAVVILCGGGVASALLVLWFRGRAHLVAVQAQAGAMMLPPPPQWQALPAPAPVRRAAAEYDAEVMPDPTQPGAWLLLLADGRRVRMLPPAR